MSRFSVAFVAALAFAVAIGVYFVARYDAKRLTSELPEKEVASVIAPESTVPPSEGSPNTTRMPFEQQSGDRSADSESEAETPGESIFDRSMRSKIAGWSEEELARRIAELREELEDLKSLHFEERIRAGLFEEVLFDSPGAVPGPQTKLPPDTFVLNRINPAERSGPRVENGVAVWWIWLPRNEYPDVYELERELLWMEDARHPVADE